MDIWHKHILESYGSILQIAIVFNPMIYPFLVLNFEIYLYISLETIFISFLSL